MKVKELIEKLQKVDCELEVLCADERLFAPQKAEKTTIRKNIPVDGGWKQFQEEVFLIGNYWID